MTTEERAADAAVGLLRMLMPRVSLKLEEGGRKAKRDKQPPGRGFLVTRTGSQPASGHCLLFGQQPAASSQQPVGPLPSTGTGLGKRGETG